MNKFCVGEQLDGRPGVLSEARAWLAPRSHVGASSATKPAAIAAATLSDAEAARYPGTVYHPFGEARRFRARLIPRLRGGVRGGLRAWVAEGSYRHDGARG